jgi:hypothetical protein
MENQRDVNILFDEMLKKGYVSSSNTWLEKAIEQKNPHLPISIANSKILYYDKLDSTLLNITWKN